MVQHINLFVRKFSREYASAKGGVVHKFPLADKNDKKKGQEAKNNYKAPEAFHSPQKLAKNKEKEPPSSSFHSTQQISNELETGAGDVNWESAQESPAVFHQSEYLADTQESPAVFHQSEYLADSHPPLQT